jgi:ABC-type arginine transport system ATPase subunit
LKRGSIPERLRKFSGNEIVLRNVDLYVEPWERDLDYRLQRRKQDHVAAVHQPVRGTLGDALGRLLFDEPISALDPGSRTEVNKVIRELGQAGLTMVVMPHDLQFAGRISDNIVFMDKGGIVGPGRRTRFCATPPRAVRRSL